MKIFVLGTRGFPNIQGGAEKHCEQLYPFISEETEIVVFRRKPYVKKDTPKRWKNISFVDLPSTKIKGVEALFHTFLSAIYTIFKRPDIAHIHNIGPGLMTPLLRLFGIKVVVTYHSPNYEHKKWNAIGRIILRIGESISLKFANAVIFVNKFQMVKLSPNGNNKMVYIPNGVVINNGESKSDKLKQWNLEPLSYILAVGRITPEKGFDLLISVHKELNPEKKLVIVGAVEAEKDYFASLKLINNPNLLFLGYQSGESLKQLYQNAYLFVLSSYNEGFPLVLLEAMSYGKPILASDIPATHLIELNTEDYFKCGDKNDLAIKLQNKLNSPKETKCTYQLDDYRWDRVAQSTLDIYIKLIRK